MRQAPKMTDIVIEETSGVDHPAHMHEGWLVIKTAHVQSEADALKSLPDGNGIEALKEASMSNDETAKGYKEDEMEPKAMEEDLAAAMARIAELEARISELEGMLDASAEAPEGEMEMSADEQVLELAKSAPEPVREMLASMVKAKAEAEAALMKEREDRADEAAITKARGDYNHLNVQAEVVGPALRRLAAIDASLAKSVEEALQAANAQSESANIFAEIGKSAPGASNTAYEKMVTLAKAAVAAGKVGSVQQGVALVATEDPALYNEYLIEKGA
jgi:hypothetical protein